MNDVVGCHGAGIAWLDDIAAPARWGWNHASAVPTFVGKAY